MEDFQLGQPVYVAPCGSGRFGNTRVVAGINPMTRKPWEPVVTIGYPAFMSPMVMVNTEIGPVAIARVSART